MNQFRILFLAILTVLLAGCDVIKGDPSDCKAMRLSDENYYQTEKVISKEVIEAASEIVNVVVTSMVKTYATFLV